jgi:hypothetical protein
MDRANVRRERLPPTAPRSLAREEQRLLLRASATSRATGRSWWCCCSFATNWSVRGESILLLAFA